MEEDIKILENLKIDTLEACKCSLSSSSDIEVWKKEAQAIENLINRVKELELENTALENTINMCPHMKTSGISCNYKDSIPKSKIREIRDKAEVMDYYTLGNVIDDLNKLLEDK